MIPGYEASAQELVRRIEALIPANPKILNEEFDVWKLFDIPGFKCNDLDTTLAMAQAALAKARQSYKEKHP